MPDIISRDAASRKSPQAENPALIAELRARIAAIEGAGPGGEGQGEGQGERQVRPLGVPEIDAALPWGGLRLAALHEVAALDAGAGVGFMAALLALLSGAEGVALWCLAARAISESGGLYGPGLAAFRLEPRRLIVVRGRSDREVLWAMEEGLRSGALAAVAAEVTELDLGSSRRLQLAAEAGGTTALLLRPRSAGLGPSAALTRWRLGAAPSAPETGAPVGPGAIGALRWRVELWRCRGGVPHDWLIEWCHETGDLRMAADLPHRPPEPAVAGRGARRHAG